MRGFIRKRGQRSYELTVELPRGPDGRRRRRFRNVSGTRRQAESALAGLVREVETGTCVDGQNVTVSEYLERWLAHMQSRIANTTYDRYAIAIRDRWSKAIGEIPLSRLQPLHIQECESTWFRGGRRDGKEGGLSALTVLHHHRILREALQQAVRWQLIGRNICDAVDPPRPSRREIRVLNEEERRHLLEVASGSPLHLAIMILLGTGMRRGELLALRWSDIDFARGVLSISRSLEHSRSGVMFKATKTIKGCREIVLPGIILEMLHRHKAVQASQRLLIGAAYKNSDLVVCEVGGSPVVPGSLTGRFRTLARKAGLTGFTLHGLRHTHATDLLRAGIHPKIASERLGHSTVGTTMDVYSHVVATMQKDAATIVDGQLRQALR